MEPGEKIEKSIEISDLSQITDAMASEVETILDKGGIVHIAQRVGPWQNESGWEVDLDGRSWNMPIAFGNTSIQEKKEDLAFDRKTVNATAFAKYTRDPFVSRTIDDFQGRITGEDFQFYSRIYDIQEWIDTIIYDVRNELYGAWSGYVIRKLTEAELFLNLTIGQDGFVEIDIVEPGLIESNDSTSGGIITHKTKKTMPIYYSIKNSDKGDYKLYPSIYVAYLDNLESFVDETKVASVGREVIKKNDEITKATKGKLKYGSYILNWKGLVREILRPASNLRTVFEPLEDHKTAKKWRSEYMKALSTYFIFYSFEDVKSWLRWIKLTDAEKRATGMGQILSPGDRLFLPPGVKAELQNPQIPTLSGQDEDVLKMISSGLRQPYDMLSGDIKGPTYASIKGTRTPYMDYISDLRELTKRFFIHDFWKAIFFIKACFDPKYAIFKEKQVVGISEKKKDTRIIKLPPERFINIIFPQSYNIDMTQMANALLGSKRGSLSYHLGMAKADVAKRLGVGNFHTSLLARATEELHYPKDILPDDTSPDALDSKTSKGTDLEAKGEKKEKLSLKRD